MARSRIYLLGGLILAWAWIGMRWLSSGDGGSPVVTTPAKRAEARRREEFPDVDLSILTEVPPSAPAGTGRDLFAYFVPPPPPPPPKTAEQLEQERRAAEEAARAAERARQEAAERARNAPPPPPPPPPPINFKFLGFVEKNGVKYATLKDDQGALHVGKEGDTVAFRYKVLKIGHETIDMGYVDNAGHQQIELTGS